MDDPIVLAEEICQDIANSVPGRQVDDPYLLNALAALVRCRSLLLSAMNDVRTGVVDLVSADCRLLFEAFVVGMYVLLAGVEGARRLVLHEERERYFINKYNDWEVERAASEDRREDELKFWEMCKTLDELSEDSEESTFFRSAYNGLYRPGSYLDIHPRLQGLGLYVDVGDETVRLARNGDDEAATGRLRMAMTLVLGLMGEVYERCGVDPTAHLQLRSALLNQGGFDPDVAG